MHEEMLSYLSVHLSRPRCERGSVLLQIQTAGCFAPLLCFGALARLLAVGQALLHSVRLGETVSSLSGVCSPSETLFVGE